MDIITLYNDDFRTRCVNMWTDGNSIDTIAEELNIPQEEVMDILAEDASIG